MRIDPNSGLERGQKYTILLLVSKEPRRGFFVCQLDYFRRAAAAPRITGMENRDK
jgi:hypothetical protein